MSKKRVLASIFAFIRMQSPTYSVLASISVKLELSRQSTKTQKRAVSQLSPVSARSARSPESCRPVTTVDELVQAGAPRDGGFAFGVRSGSAAKHSLTKFHIARGASHVSSLPPVKETGLLFHTPI